MKQKDLINQGSLNDTQITSNALDNSSQIIISSSNSAARRTPLHSHYLQYNGNGSIKQKLRLLNGNAKSQVKLKLKIIQQHDKFPNKPVFGCSQSRQLNMFQVKQQASETTNNTSQLAIILHKNSTPKTSEYSQEQHKNPTQMLSSSLQSQTKRGFGLTGHIERVSSMDVIYKAGGPGPGQYELHPNIKYTKQNKNAKGKVKNIFGQVINTMSTPKRLIGHMNVSEQCSQNKILRMIPPGPGSYNLPCLSSPKQDYLIREKWKQINVEKKNKIKLMLEQLNSSQNTKEASLKEIKKFQKHIHRYPHEPIQMNKNQLKQTRQPMSIIENKYKYLRNQLRDKTNKFLPTISQTNLQYQNRGPIYKHLQSNCFVLKNDYAFQAHYYKQPQKQSQYILIKAGKPQNFQYNFV